MEGDPGHLVYPAIEGLVADRQRLQGEHLVALLWAESDAVGDR